MSPGTIDLPGHYNTELVGISPANFDGSSAFCSILDELKVEMEESPENEGFYHNRSSLVKAYGEHRMYGLCVRWSEQMLEHKSFNDAIFVTNKHMMANLMLPCFIVIDNEENDKGLHMCSFIWTAERARKRGLATYMLHELDVGSVSRPMQQAESFWSNHFARRDEIAEGSTAEMCIQ